MAYRILHGFVGIALAAAVFSCNDGQQSPQVALQRAVDFLVREQDPDGGWHSPTHGFLRDGQAWTPFVLLQLTEVRERGTAVIPDSTIALGFAFLRKHISRDGVLGTFDPEILEYPNYATAVGLHAFLKLGEPADQKLADAMVDYLLRQQYTEQRGIDSSNLAYGSWGFGEPHLRSGSTGHVDLSHTRRVLEALHAYAASGTREPELLDRIGRALERSQLFLAAAQKHPSDSRVVLGNRPQNQAPYDGGFYASPVVHGTNKAGSRVSAGVEYFASYATTTGDGILALLAADVMPDDERIASALAWLDSHPSLDAPGGITPGQPGDWERVMFFYHLATRTRILRSFPRYDGWRRVIAEIVVPRQRQDGSFVNPEGTLNKEDDPILATILAIESLAAATD